MPTLPAADQAPSSTPVATRYGGHSMTARLRSVLVRRPAPPAGPDDWRRFGYVRPVDHALAEREHAAFREILGAEGVDVVAAGPDPEGELDAIFAFDPSIVTDAGAVLCRMGKPARRAEAEFAERAYVDLGIPVLGRIEEPGMVEGGDTCWLDERTLAVGRGYRTNGAGITQLAAILAGIGIEVVAVDLPHWRGPGECLHLLSLISPVAPNLAVVYLPLLAAGFVEELREREWRLVQVPDEEFDTLGCNVLALAPGRGLMEERNSVIRARLEAAGCEIVTYSGKEISLNRAGGPTCLTRPLWRDD